MLLATSCGNRWSRCRCACAVPLTVFTLDYLVRYPDHSVRDVAAKVRVDGPAYMLFLWKGCCTP